MHSTEIRQRLKALPWLKALGHTLAISGFFLAYCQVMTHPLFPVTAMPLLLPDRWMPLWPWTVWVYFSLWVYISLPATLIGSRRVLWHLFLGALLMAVLGFLVFVFYPTTVPEWGVDWERYPEWLSFLKSPELSGNACPSMHVSYAVFAGLWLAALQRRLGVGAFWRWGGGLWGLAIVLSTQSTKQHVFIDLVFGTLLGLVVFYLNRCWMRRAGVSL